MVHRNAIEFVPKYREVRRNLATSAMAQPIQHVYRLELAGRRQLKIWRHASTCGKNGPSSQGWDAAFSSFIKCVSLGPVPVMKTAAGWSPVKAKCGALAGSV